MKMMISKRLLNFVLIFILIVSLGNQQNTSLKINAEEKGKLKYLILTVKTEDKKLYKNYIQEREKKYDIQIISLQEKNTPNKAPQVKKLLKAIKKDFDFYYAAFSSKIAFSYEIFWEGKMGTSDWVSDSYYTNLYDKVDNNSEFLLSRIIDSSLGVEWKTLILGSSYIEIAEPFRKFPYYNKFCSGCIDREIDASESGEEEKHKVIDLGFKAITLYDTDSSMQPKYKPDKPLNKKNHAETFKNAFVFIGGSTWEPLNVFDDYKITKYETFCRAIWTDADKNGVVDNYKSEIEVEEFESLKNPDNIKRIALLGSFDQHKNFNLDKLGKFFYAFVFGGNLSELLKGETISESVSDKYLYDIAFGPPETRLIDVVSSPTISLSPSSIQESSVITIPLKEKEYKFQIMNQGDADLNFTIEVDSHEITITPLTATVAPNGSQEITIKLGGLPNIPTIEPLSSPKKKSTQMRIISNCFEKTKVINIKWTGT